MKPFKTNCSYCRKSIIRANDRSIHFCDNGCKGEWQKRDGKPVTEEWLRDSYLNNKMNCTEIAHKVKRDPKSVWNWLKGFGIQTRARGYGQPKNWIQKGHRSLFYGHKHTDEARRRMRLIALSDGRVPYDPLVGSYMKGRKGSDTPSWKGGMTPERQSFYSSVDWKKCVVKVWRRDDAKCCRCGLDHRTIERGHPRFHIHHIDSFSIRSQRSILTNLVLLCWPCHIWVHSKKNIMGDYLGKGH